MSVPDIILDCLPQKVAQFDPACQCHFSVSQHAQKYNPSVTNFTAGVPHQKCIFAQLWALDPRL